MAQQKSKNRRLIEATIKIVVSIGALYLVFRQIEFKEVKEVFLSARYVFLLPALLFFIFSKIISAFRLNIFFRQINVHISEQSNLKLYWTGMFYNMFLPGGIGGDGYKVYLLSTLKKVKAKKLIWMVFLDRLSGVLILGMLAVFFLGFLEITHGFRFHIWAALVSGTVVLLFVVKKYQPLIWQISGKVILLSLGVQIMQLISVIWILSAFGFFKNVMGYLTIFLISSVVSIIPITIGGAGTRELTFLYGSGFLNLQTDISITLSLTFYMITLVASLAGIIYALRSSDYLENGSPE